MKIGIVYTASSDELEQTLHDAAHRLIGSGVEISSYQDLTPLKEANAGGFVAPRQAALYASMIMKAMMEGCDAVLSTCCFMGDVVNSLKPFAAYAGVLLASIDEEMCRHALLECGDIAMAFTAPVAGESVGHTVERKARELGRYADVRKLHVVPKTGAGPEAIAKQISDSLKSESADADGVILAQPSMAPVAPHLRKLFGGEVYCTNDEGMLGLRRQLEGRGLELPSI